MSEQFANRAGLHKLGSRQLGFPSNSFDALWTCERIQPLAEAQCQYRHFVMEHSAALWTRGHPFDLVGPPKANLTGCGLRERRQGFLRFQYSRDFIREISHDARKEGQSCA